MIIDGNIKVLKVSIYVPSSSSCSSYLYISQPWNIAVNVAYRSLGWPTIPLGLPPPTRGARFFLLRMASPEQLYEQRVGTNLSTHEAFVIYHIYIVTYVKIASGCIRRGLVFGQPRNVQAYPIFYIRLPALLNPTHSICEVGFMDNFIDVLKTSRGRGLGGMEMTRCLYKM